MLSPGQQEQARVGGTSQPSTSEVGTILTGAHAGQTLDDLASAAEREGRTDATFMKVSFERYISQITSAAEMEAHEERLKKLSETARNLSKDEWMFTPIEKLLGNSSQ